MLTLATWKCVWSCMVTDIDLRRLKFKFLNKKPLDDDDNYENECD